MTTHHVPAVAVRVGAVLSFVTVVPVMLPARPLMLYVYVLSHVIRVPVYVDPLRSTHERFVLDHVNCIHAVL